MIGFTDFNVIFMRKAEKKLSEKLLCNALQAEL